MQWKALEEKLQTFHRCEIWYYGAAGKFTYVSLESSSTSFKINVSILKLLVRWHNLSCSVDYRNVKDIVRSYLSDNWYTRDKYRYSKQHTWNEKQTKEICYKAYLYYRLDFFKKQLWFISQINKSIGELLMCEINNSWVFVWLFFNLFLCRKRMSLAV